MKPVVGVMPLWDDEKESIWMLPGYMDGIVEAGGTPIIFPFSEDENELSGLVSLCGGIMLTGGHDVEPKIYGEEPMQGLVECCEKRDVMEKIVLDLAMKADKAILGICRGIQLINASLGGTLYQDLPLQHPSETEHRQKPPYHVPAHEVKLIAGSPLYKCLGVETMGVNSCHHQAVKDLARSLEIMAVTQDGLVEALYAPDRKFLWAVQWHPEFSYKTDAHSRSILREFVKAAGM